MPNVERFFSIAFAHHFPKHDFVNIYLRKIVGTAGIEWGRVATCSLNAPHLVLVLQSCYDVGWTNEGDLQELSAVRPFLKIGIFRFFRCCRRIVEWAALFANSGCGNACCPVNIFTSHCKLFGRAYHLLRGRTQTALPRTIFGQNLGSREGSKIISMSVALSSLSDWTFVIEQLLVMGFAVKEWKLKTQRSDKSDVSESGRSNVQMTVTKNVNFLIFHFQMQNGMFFALFLWPKNIDFQKPVFLFLLKRSSFMPVQGRQIYGLC